MRIGMLSADWGDYATSSPGGCTWIRFFGPGQALINMGHEVHIGECGWKDDEGFVVVPTYRRLTHPDRGLIKVKEGDLYEGNIDVVIFKLWMWEHASEYIKKARELGQTVIIDIDDWFDGLPTTNIAFWTTHPDKDKSWNRNHMLGTYNHVNGLITSTQFLYNNYSKKNKNTYLVRNSLDPKFFVKRYDSAGEKPTIGWVGIMIWRSGDIETLQGWLGQFLEKHDLKFHHAGLLLDNPKEFAEIAKIDPERLQGTSGCSPQYYGNILLPFDIGIVPLNTMPFNEAKSNLKGLEYAMTGIPFVASSTNEYRLLAEQGAGNVATKPMEWIKNLEKLIDPDVRREQAERGYNLVMDKYNINNVVHEWHNVIEEIHLSNDKRRSK